MTKDCPYVAPCPRTRVLIARICAVGLPALITLFYAQPILGVTVQMILYSVGTIMLGSLLSLERLRRATAAVQALSRGEGLSKNDVVVAPIFAGMVLTSIYVAYKWLPDSIDDVITFYLTVVGCVAWAWSVLSVLKLLREGSRLARNGYDVEAMAAADAKREAEKTAAVARGEAAPVPPHHLCRLFGGKNKIVLDQTPIIPQGTLPAKVGQYVEGASVADFFGAGETGEIEFSNLHLLVALVALLLGVIFFTTRNALVLNLLSSGICIQAMVHVSISKFNYGLVLLAGLFFYDIFFVFGTDIMVTVARRVDGPIKFALFDAAKPDKPGLLGLGDVVIPGVVIAFALRVDAWMAVSRAADRATEEKAAAAKKAGNGKSGDAKKGKERAAVADDEEEVPIALFIEQAVESHGLQSLFATFHAHYFVAGIISYVVGLLLTALVMYLSAHPQPALLYLSPCVALSAILTGKMQGSWTEATEYIEDEKVKDESGVDAADVDVAGKKQK